ncbi:M48 family metallopeptidase [Salidesulfovibrio onnuriiensis]|uniref:M48 family metallopeptidase n=1 Tax=Salidesulfovibrio onnuriiensis TaxID=2583823 RepID=UPI0032B7CB2D
MAPQWILPQFNKFTPLQDGELKQKIEAYAAGQGYTVSGIFVMDGSKRSTKANAFFTGFGKTKRIALFDTLLENHTADELLAVLAHEVGHGKLGHIKKQLLTMVLKTGAVFYLLSLFLGNQGLFDAFGMQQMSTYAGLVFFGLLYTPVSMVLSLLANRVSRKHEFEADAFAAKTTGDHEQLVIALKRLSANSLSNLTPHWLTVWLEYGHPPVLQRIRALRRV